MDAPDEDLSANPDSALWREHGDRSPGVGRRAFFARVAGVGVALVLGAGALAGCPAGGEDEEDGEDEDD